MKASLKTSKGDLIREAAENYGKIHASAIIGEEQLRKILGTGFCSDARRCAEKLVPYLKQSEVLCRLHYYPQNPSDPQNSRDHLVIEFVINFLK